MGKEELHLDKVGEQIAAVIAPYLETIDEETYLGFVQLYEMGEEQESGSDEEAKKGRRTADDSACAALSAALRRRGRVIEEP